MPSLGRLLPKNLVIEGEARGLILCRQQFGQSAVVVEDAVAVEMQDVNGRLPAIFEALPERIEGGRVKELAGDAAGGVLVQGIEHGLRVGAGVEEAGAFGTAHDEQQVQVLFRGGPERHPPIGGAGEAAANADVGVLVKEVSPRGIVEQLPRQPEHGGVVGAQGEQAARLFTILEAIEQALRHWIRKDGERRAPAPRSGNCAAMRAASLSSGSPKESVP